MCSSLISLPISLVLTIVIDINNVGSMAQALYAFENPVYDPIKAAKWQATQVSTISINNCLGRIAIGEPSMFAFFTLFV